MFSFRYLPWFFIPFTFFAGLTLRLFILESGDPDPTCQYALSTGSWRRFSSVWSPHGCYLHSYHADIYDIDRCFADFEHDIRYVFVGDSTARQVFWGMVDLVDGKLGSGDYSVYTSQRHSNFDLSFSRFPSNSQYQNRRSSIYLSFIWDPFFNSSAIYELHKHFDQKNSPIAVVYTSIGLWFSRHFSDDEIYDEFTDATNRVSFALHSLHSTLPTRQGTRNDMWTTHDNSRTHSLYLAPVLHSYTPYLTPDRARDMTHDKVHQLNWIINRLKSLSYSNADELSASNLRKIEKHYDLANVDVPTIFNTFSNGYPQGYDKMGIHFNRDLSGTQALFLTNLRCNSALAHSRGRNPPNYPLNEPRNNTFNYPNYQACCAGPSTHSETIIIWTSLVTLSLFVFLFRKRGDRRHIASFSSSILQTIVRALFWVSIFISVRTGVTGVQREISTPLDIVVVVCCLIFSATMWLNSAGLKTRSRFAFYQSTGRGRNVFKGLVLLLYMVVSGLLPDIAHYEYSLGEDFQVKWGQTFFWVVSNILTALFIYDSCKFGESVSYTTSHYLSSIHHLIGGKEDADSDSEFSDEINTDTHINNFNLKIQSNLDSLLSALIGSSYSAHYTFAFVKSIFCIFSYTCFPFCLIFLVHLFPDVFSPQSNPLLSIHPVPILIFNSEYHFAITLFASSFLSWAFFLFLRKSADTKEFRHPHEIAQGATRIGYKIEYYFTYGWLFTLILTTVIYVLNFGISWSSSSRSVHYCHFTGISVCSFLAFLFAQFYFSCTKLIQEQLRYIYKMVYYVVGISVIALFMAYSYGYGQNIKFMEDSANYSHEMLGNFLYKEGMGKFFSNIVEFLFSILIAGLIIHIELSDIKGHDAKLKSEDDIELDTLSPDIAQSQTTGTETQSRSHSRNCSESFMIASTELDSSNSNSLQNSFHQTGALESNPTGSVVLKESKDTNFLWKHMNHLVFSTLLSLGKYSLELVVISVFVFNIPIFQELTPRASLHTTDIAYYYWTIPRSFATHGSFVPIQIFDTLLGIGMMVFAARDISIIAGRSYV